MQQLTQDTQDKVKIKLKYSYVRLRIDLCLSKERTGKLAHESLIQSQLEGFIQINNKE